MSLESTSAKQVATKPDLSCCLLKPPAGSIYL